MASFLRTARLGVALVRLRLCLFALALVVTGCKFADALDAIPETVIKRSVTRIESWASIGPFDSGADEEAQGTNFLAAYGLPEEGRIVSDYVHGARKLKAESKLRVLAAKHMVDFYSSYALPKGSDFPSPSFYAVCRLTASAEAEAWLLLGSDAATKVWFNGAAVSTNMKRREFDQEPYHLSVRVSLKKGSNDLVIKLARVKASCGLIGTLALDAEAAVQELREENRSALRNLLIGDRSPLTLELRGAPPGVSVSVKVADVEGNVVANLGAAALSGTPFRFDAPAPGLYQAKVDFGGTEWSEEFYYGDVEKTAQALLSRAKAAEAGAREKLELRTLMRRIEILMAPANREPAKREWQRKIVFTFSELGRALGLLEKKAPLGGSPGVHLKGFVSGIDGVERHYRIFIPRGYDPRTPLPMAVMVATATSAARPFIESAFVAHQLDAEAMGAIAEKRGLAILWPGYPAQPFGNACEFAHFDEVMAEVERDYNLDKDRIHLLGTCQGGMVALMMAKMWPGRFASLGLLDPIATRGSNRLYGDGDVFLGSDTYLQSIADRNPLAGLEVLKPLPTRVLFDDGAQGHGTLRDSQAVVDAASKAGTVVQFDKVPLSLGHLGAWRSLIEWCGGIRRQPPPKRGPKADARGGGAVGPISAVFPEGFLLVEGTSGSPVQLESIRRATAEFKSAWRASYYGDCPLVADIALTPALERTKNLVLVGTPETNSAFARLAAHLPIEIRPDEIVVRGRKYSSRNLSVQAVFQHPTYQDRRVVVIGGSGPGSFRFGTMDLSIDGWFDFAIWKCDLAGNTVSLLSAGRY
jgi:pimeloyl-ACP methyl ester carboxylesterase